MVYILVYLSKLDIEFLLHNNFFLFYIFYFHLLFLIIQCLFRLSIKYLYLDGAWYSVDIHIIIFMNWVNIISNLITVYLFQHSLNWESTNHKLHIFIIGFRVKFLRTYMHLLSRTTWYCKEKFYNTNRTHSENLITMIIISFRHFSTNKTFMLEMNETLYSIWVYLFIDSKVYLLPRITNPTNIPGYIFLKLIKNWIWFNTINPSN